MSKLIQGEIHAYMSQSYYGSIDLHNGEPCEVLGLLTYAKSDDMASYGWTLVGKAYVTLEPVPRNKLIENKVAALRGEIGTIRAKASKETMELESKIESLLALAYTPTTNEEF